MNFLNRILLKPTCGFYSIPIILLLSFSQSCKEKPDCYNGEPGTFRNYTGLDGCGWVIEFSDSTKVEPTNLNSFGIDPGEGKKVYVSYREINDMMSTCVVGKMIEIIEIKEK